MRNDEQFLLALNEISKIESRFWPENEPLFAFSEDFESDASGVRRFCKARRIFAHRLAYIQERWDIVLYLSKSHFLFYLPAIMLASIDKPTASLASALIKYRGPSEQLVYTVQEQVAFLAVKAYVEEIDPPRACSGSTSLGASP